MWLRFPPIRRQRVLRQLAIPSARSYQPDSPSNEKLWENLSISLTDATELTRFDIAGSGLWLIRATNAAGNISHAAEISVRLNGSGGWIPLRSGNSSLGTRFQFIEAKWQAFAGITATLLYLREGTIDASILNQS